jgi:hypothetical protein
VRMVAEISGQHDSEWAAISEVARLLGVGTAETVRSHPGFAAGVGTDPDQSPAEGEARQNEVP